MLGLDNAGKTTILKGLAGEDPSHVMPTQGFNIKGVSKDGVTLNMWDIGGQKTIRPYWSNYFDGSDGLIFVVDSSDNRRLEESAMELRDLLAEDKLANVPLLVFANKQDLSTAVQDTSELLEAMGLDRDGHFAGERTWTIVACSAKSGEGLQEGLDWLTQFTS